MRNLFLSLVLFSGLAFAPPVPVKPPSLTAIDNDDVSTSDLLLLYDSSAGITKKYSISEADSRWSVGGGGEGTVTSVAMSVPSALLAVSGSPITESGTLALSLPTRAANLVFAGPASGSAATPVFRLLDPDDVPSLSTTKLTSGTLGIARGGTNSATALNNNRVMKSAGDAIVEAAAITASRVLVSDSNGIPTHSSVTTTTLGYVDPTSSIQTQLDGKQATGSYITALTGDVTASGPGSAAATIANNVVSNAKLATVSTATFKGRTTAGTGNVEDLTATQATALLNAFTGDSGSGGVKGLVPAPASGDAAAGKFLKANGAWAAPTVTYTQHEHWVRGGNNFGAVATKIRRFSNEKRNQGTCIDYADSANDGASWTIDTGCAGVYCIYYNDTHSSSANFGVSTDINIGTQGATNIYDLSDVSDRMLMYATAQSSSSQVAMGGCFYFADGTVIRAHGEGLGGTNPHVMFKIVKAN